MTVAHFATPVTPLRAPKVADLVVEALRRRIALAEFAEGEDLPPGTVLMAQYGISRPTLREALRVLESEHLVTVRRGAHGGAQVQMPSAEVAARYAGLLLQLRGTTLGDLHRARAVIEAPLAPLVAERTSPEVVARLQEALDAEAAVLDDPVAYGYASLDFHDTVAELTGNTTLHAIVSLLSAVVARHTEVRMREEEGRSPRLDRRRADIQRSHKAHQKLVRLVAAGDATGARRFWGPHVEEIGHELSERGSPKKVVDLF